MVLICKFTTPNAYQHSPTQIHTVFMLLQIWSPHTIFTLFGCWFCVLISSVCNCSILFTLLFLILYMLQMNIFVLITLDYPVFVLRSLTFLHLTCPPIHVATNCIDFYPFLYLCHIPCVPQFLDLFICSCTFWLFPYLDYCINAEMKISVNIFKINVFVLEKGRCWEVEFHVFQRIELHITWMFLLYFIWSYPMAYCFTYRDYPRWSPYITVS